MYRFRKDILEGTDIEATLRHDFPEVRFNMRENGNTVELQIIVVQHLRRNQSEGKKFMKRLIELAHQNNKNVALTPDASYSSGDDMNQSQLTKWYERLGFKKKPLNKFTHSIINN